MDMRKLGLALCWWTVMQSRSDNKHEIIKDHAREPKLMAYQRGFKRFG